MRVENTGLEMGPWNQSSTASRDRWLGGWGREGEGMPPPGGQTEKGDMSKGSRCLERSVSVLTYSGLWGGSGERSVLRSIRLELGWPDSDQVGGSWPGRSL